MGRPPVNETDAVGKVRVVVHLVGTRHRPIKGNRTRVMTLPNARVTTVAEIIVEAIAEAARKGKL